MVLSCPHNLLNDGLLLARRISVFRLGIFIRILIKWLLIGVELRKCLLFAIVHSELTQTLTIIVFGRVYNLSTHLVGVASLERVDGAAEVICTIFSLGIQSISQRLLWVVSLLAEILAQLHCLRTQHSNTLLSIGLTVQHEVLNLIFWN